MSELTSDELAQLEQLANSEKPWADAVKAYLDAIKEVDPV